MTHQKSGVFLMISQDTQTFRKSVQKSTGVRTRRRSGQLRGGTLGLQDPAAAVPSRWGLSSKVNPETFTKLRLGDRDFYADLPVRTTI